MQIKSAILKKIDIPFNISFKHSSAERSETESVLVEMTSDGILMGYGESCPRLYVTSENLSTVTTFIHTHLDSFKEQVSSLKSLVKWMNENEKYIDKNPAAMCAIEIAFLDLLAKHENVSIEKLLNLPKLSGHYQYSAVIGDSSSEVFCNILEKYLAMGFSDFKIKLSGDIAKDQEKCQVIKNGIQKSYRLRFDANNLWEDYKFSYDYLSNLDIDYFAIEEPLMLNNYIELSKLAQKLNKQIILDESFLKLSQMRHLVDNPDLWILNLRISKMGGLMRSKIIIDQAREAGIKVIIGAQVGETSILTRAALTIANYANDLVIAQEGAFGNLLLKRDVCDPPIMFSKDGKLEASMLPTKTNGFGIEMTNKHKFEDLS